MGEIWQRYIQHQTEKGKGAAKLPIIYPLSFYHGRQSPYPYSMDIQDCFENRTLAGELFDQPFPLVDVTQYQDEELDKHGLAANFEIIQKHIFARDLWATIQHLLKTRQLAQLLHSSSGEYFEQLIKYIVSAGEIDNIDEFFKTLTEQLPEASEDIMTIAQQLEQRGEQRGRAAEAAEIAREMLELGIEKETIAKATKLPVSEVEKLNQHWLFLSWPQKQYPYTLLHQ